MIIHQQLFSPNMIFPPLIDVALSYAFRAQKVTNLPTKL